MTEHPIIAVWSPKHGSGTTTFAAALAVDYANHGIPVTVADLGGDLPAIFAMPDTPDVGLFDWLNAAADEEPKTDSLSRLLVHAHPDVWLAPLGTLGELPDHTAGNPLTAAARLANGLRAVTNGPVIVDAGTASGHIQRTLVDRADVSLLVTQGCYLSLRRGVAHGCTRHAAGVVLVRQPGRALGPREVADVLERPVLTTIPYDPSVARAVDAGTFAVRLPACLPRRLAHLRGNLPANAQVSDMETGLTPAPNDGTLSG